MGRETSTLVMVMIAMMTLAFGRGIVLSLYQLVNLLVLPVKQVRETLVAVLFVATTFGPSVSLLLELGATVSPVLLSILHIVLQLDPLLGGSLQTNLQVLVHLLHVSQTILERLHDAVASLELLHLLGDNAFKERRLRRGTDVGVPVLSLLLVIG